MCQIELTKTQALQCANRKLLRSDPFQWKAHQDYCKTDRYREGTFKIQGETRRNRKESNIPANLGCATIVTSCPSGSPISAKTASSRMIFRKFLLLTYALEQSVGSQPPAQTGSNALSYPHKSVFHKNRSKSHDNKLRSLNETQYMHIGESFLPWHIYVYIYTIIGWGSGHWRVKE